MSERIPHADMVSAIASQIAGKAKWLADFSSGPKKRPDNEIQAKRREMAVLEQARDDYRRAADRTSKTAETGSGVGTDTPVSAAQNRRVGAR